MDWTSANVPSRHCSRAREHSRRCASIKFLTTSVRNSQVWPRTVPNLLSMSPMYPLIYTDTLHVSLGL
jgi:hypothetical protein